MNTTQKKIVEGVAQLLLVYHPHQIKKRHIAELIGINPSAFYYYYKTKETLFISVLEEQARSDLKKAHAISQNILKTCYKFSEYARLYEKAQKILGDKFTL